MQNRSNKLLIAILSIVVILSMALTGTIVYIMADANKSPASNSSLVNQADPSTDDSSSITEGADNSSTAGLTDNETATSDDQKLIWAKYDVLSEIGGYSIDSSWSESSAVFIMLNDSTADISGNGATADSEGVITITAAGTYIIRGELKQGSIVVEAGATDLVKLILDDASISSSGAAPILVKSADKVILIAAEGSTNKLSDLRQAPADESSGDEEEYNAAIYSKSNLYITGNGSIGIDTSWSDGINGRDELYIEKVELNIEAADDGINGRDLLFIDSGNINIVSGGDGIKSSNNSDQTVGHIVINNGDFTIAADRDGIQAAGQLLINDGEFEIVTGGGSIQAPTVDESATPGGGFGAMPNEEFGGRGGRMPGGMMPGGTTDDIQPIDPDANSMATPDQTSQTAMITNASTETESTSSKALKADIKVRVAGGSITIDSADDSVHSNFAVIIEAGMIDLTSGDDGIHADNSVVINGGSIKINKSYEGIESKLIIINNGEIDIKASDDGINIAGGQDASAMGGRPGQNSFSTSGDQRLEISGGKIVVDAQGDGIDVNGTASMSGGNVIVYGPTSNANGALDYDGGFELTGGTLLAVGSSGMAQSVSSSSQTVLAFSAEVALDSSLSITDSANKAILTVQAPRAYSTVIYTSPELESGTVYKVIVDGSELGQISG